LFVSIGNNHGIKLGHDGILRRYVYYKKTYFPSLLLDPTISEPDKSVIRNLLTKPFNPYVLRHSSLTEKSTILPEAVLRLHAGWTADSAMPRTYIHLNDESSKILLEKRGIITKNDQETANINKSKICTNCNETNRPDVKWCIKCKMVLSYTSYQETLQKEQEKENQIKELVTKVDKLSEDNSKTQDFILQMFDKFEQVDMIESQKELQKLAEKKGKYYAMYPDGEPLSESEKLQKEIKDDVFAKWALMLLNRPDLQKKYNVKMIFKDK